MGLRALSDTIDVVVPVSAVESNEFTIARWAKSIGALFGAIDTSVVVLEVAEESGGTFIPVVDIGIAQKTKTLGYVDFGEYVKGAPYDWVYRFKFSKAQVSGPHTIKISMRG